MRTTAARALVSIAAALLAAGPAAAQRAVNLDFEEPSLVTPGRPAAWQIRAVENDPFALDSAVRRSGRASLRTRPTAQMPAIAQQYFPPGLARGRTLRVSGWVRTDSVTQGSAALWVRVEDASGRVLAFDNMEGRGVSGTADWRRVQVEVAVDSAAGEVAFGVLHAGGGTAWFDALELEVDGTRYDPADAWKPTPADRAWARSRVVRFSSTDPAYPPEDLRTVLPLVGEARVVALGEGTHGTREFFQMKHRLTQLLARERGFTVFAIEASMPEARAVNEYVLTGRGDPRQALAGMFFWTWNTQEVLDLIEWMRAYNASGEGRMEFWGFDMQFPMAAMDSVRAFVQRADPSLSPSVAAAYDSIAAVARDPARRTDAPALERWTALADGVLRQVEAGRPRWLTAGRDRMEVEWAVQYARLVSQASRTAERDAAMAANLRWILAHQPAGTRAVVWAHNYHVSREPGAMGWHLAREMGTTLRVFGFAFGEGSYTARGGRGLASYSAPPPPPGTVEEFLRSLALQRFVLDLRVSPPPPPGAGWVLEPRDMRSIGSGALDMPFYPARLGEWYDALIYIDRTTPTVQLSTPRPDPFR